MFINNTNFDFHKEVTNFDHEKMLKQIQFDKKINRIVCQLGEGGKEVDLTRLKKIISFYLLGNFEILTW